ncbi:MAG TPA: S8 family peptidase, partial [Motiliproteus sp.]
QMVPGELLVRFSNREFSSKGARTGLQSTLSTLGLQQVGSAMGQTALVRLPSNSADQQRLQQALPTPATLPFYARDPQLAQRLAMVYAAKALARRADIESADPNYLYQPQALPNDPFYSLQWHYPMINLPQAWDIETGSSNPVTVAVVDTGVVLSHPDLQGQLVAGYDFISDPLRAGDGNGIDSNPDDPGDNQTPGGSSFHGTHVAGTIAAASNNGVGVAGVAWGATIMPIRVLGQGGGTSNDILQGVRYAAGLSNSANQLPITPAAIINLSLGCNGCFSATESAAYADIVRDSGAILIAAAGNENSSQPSYPAAYPGIISVAAVDRRKARAPYSNFGSSIDVAAPGGDSRSDADGDGYPDGILSTAVDDSGGSRQTTYLFQNGTSMAAPHVSGVVALMKAVNPDFITPIQLAGLLSSGALTEDVAANGASVRDDIYGYGLIDALKAIQAAQNGEVPTTLTLSPNTLSFGPFTSAQQLSLSTTGSGSVTVNSLTPSAPWLSASGSGIGAYSISVDRSGLADGHYPATLIINYSIDNTPREINIPVSMQVGSPANVIGDTGYTYIILIDSQSGDTVASVDRASANGEYSFSFSRVPPGDYLLVAGSDADNDGFICDAGESCGGYPTLAQLQPLTITADLRRSDIDFVSTFEVSVGNTTLQLQPTTGYARHPSQRDKQWSRTP